MAALRSKAVLTAPKRHFRFAPINGHHQTGPVGPVRATSGSEQPIRSPRWRGLKASQAPRRVLANFDSDQRRAEAERSAIKIFKEHGRERCTSPSENIRHEAKSCPGQQFGLR